MEDLFPKDTLSTNPLLDKTKNALKTTGGTSLFEEEFEIRFSASNKECKPKDKVSKDEFNRNGKILVKKGKLGKQNDPKDNLFEFFWKIFGSSSDHVLDRGVKDSDGINKNLLAFEKKNANVAEKGNFVTFQSHRCYEEFKRIFAGGVKRADGTNAKIE